MWDSAETEEEDEAKQNERQTQTLERNKKKIFKRQTPGHKASKHDPGKVKYRGIGNSQMKRYISPPKQEKIVNTWSRSCSEWTSLTTNASSMEWIIVKPHSFPACVYPQRDEIQSCPDLFAACSTAYRGRCTHLWQEKATLKQLVTLTWRVLWQPRAPDRGTNINGSWKKNIKIKKLFSSLVNELIKEHFPPRLFFSPSQFMQPVFGIWQPQTLHTSIMLDAVVLGARERKGVMFTVPNPWHPATLLFVHKEGRWWWKVSASTVGSVEWLFKQRTERGRAWNREAACTFPANRKKQHIITVCQTFHIEFEQVVKGAILKPACPQGWSLKAEHVRVS